MGSLLWNTVIQHSKNDVVLALPRTGCMRVELICSDHTEPTTYCPMYSFVNKYNTEMCAEIFQLMECVIALVFV